jgi:hypothetical protein
MFPVAPMIAPPGFFSFRWQPTDAPAGFEDVAVVFKVPGSVDMAVLPDLVEDVCRGPLVPSAVMFVHLRGDASLVDAITSEPTNAALLRFDGRMPLVVASVDLRDFEIRLSDSRGVGHRSQARVRRLLSACDEWLAAGLAAVFDPAVVIVPAPAGYVFHKPSSRRSGYFIRAELGLTTSGAVSFVALAIFRRLLRVHEGLPEGLKVLFVDTMSVATTAFALRELLSQAGLTPLPQIDSFHSYGGMESVGAPLPGASLCIISASSSMNMHREWREQKRLSDRDSITLVTFDDAVDEEHALYAMPSGTKPEEPATSAKYDIRIAGENFFPVIEPPRKVLLTGKHSCSSYTQTFHTFRGRSVLGVYRGTMESPARRSLFVDGGKLLACEEFQRAFNAKLSHWLKAGTTQVVYQDDTPSQILARHAAYALVKLGGKLPDLVRLGDVSVQTIDKAGAIVCIAAVVSRGNALLSLSRELRNIHEGPRLYLIGAQVTESQSKITTFDSNLKHSSHGACIDVQRIHTFLMDEVVGDSFADELATIYAVQRGNDLPPQILRDRVAALRRGNLEAMLLPTGSNLDETLSLNEGFAFWPANYAAGPFQAEVIATIAAILQNARTVTSLAMNERLRSPMLMQVALDPENFARFNDAIIQSSILRAALPSELDYRGDADASGFIRVFLERMASKIGRAQQAELEFLTALVTGRLRLNADDLEGVRQAFLSACAGQHSLLSRAVRYLVERFPRAEMERVAF